MAEALHGVGADANVRPGMPATSFPLIATDLPGTGPLMVPNTQISDPLGAPVAPTTGTAASGALAAADAYVKVTYVDPNGGETTPSPVTHQAITINHVLTVTSPAARDYATKYNVYADYANAGAGPFYLQNASPINLGTGFQEANTGPVTGTAQPPATDNSSEVAGFVIPLQSFTYLMKDGSTQTFYKGMARVVNTDVAAALLAKGLVRT